MMKKTDDGACMRSDFVPVTSQIRKARLDEVWHFVGHFKALNIEQENRHKLLLLNPF
jgi:hypothetical protein